MSGWLPFSDPPDDPDDFASWLADVEERVAAATSDRLVSLIVECYTRFVGTLSAAGDPSAWDTFSPAWERFVSVDLGPAVGGVYLGGSASAWVTAPTTKVPVESARAWLDVVNDDALDYMRQATNRIVGAGENVWREVQSKTYEALSQGVEPETLKRQIEAVTGYSEFRADTIARTEVNGAFTGGAMDGARALGEYGPVEKVWSAVGGPRSRESHEEADGQCVPIDEPFYVGGYPMDRPHDPAAPPGEVVNCRCAVLFLYPGDLRPDGSTVPGAEPETEPEPDRWEPEPFTGTLTEAADQPPLGGAHPKTVLVDENGVRYLHKPQEAWLAHAESAASEIAARAGIDVPRVTIHTHNGQVGSLQRMVDNPRPGFPGSQHGFDPTLVARADLHEIQRHRVLDWALGNHDGHAGQYVRSGYANQGARVVGIDKGQAWRWYGADEKLDFRFHPNARYGEARPAANLIEQAFAEGRLQRDDVPFAWRKRSPTGTTARAIEAIPDDEYRAILRGYAEGRWTGDAAQAARFLDDMVARKNALSADFTRYHRRLEAQERKTRPKPQPSLDGKNGPKGMHGAAPSSDDLDWLRRYDHPLTDRAGADAVVRYSGSTYHEINGALRAGQPHRLTAGVDRHLLPVRDDMVVYRGVGLGNRLPPGGHTSVQGQAILDPAFQSTSAGVAKGPAFGGDTALVVRVNSGTRGAYIDPISANRGEREFLLERNQPLYVHKVRRPDPAGPSWERRYEWIMEVETVDRNWLAGSDVKVWNTATKNYDR